MSTPPARPRGAVIAEAWRAAGIDAPELVNRSGLPLARTSKRLLDPLVIRPRLRRNLAAALLTDADAAELRALLVDARPRLERASRWYALLRAERAARGITAGDPQELYFPLAHELAVAHGEPGPDAALACAEALAELHGDGADPLEAVRARLADAAVATRIRERWAAAWLDAEDAGGARSPGAGAGGVVAGALGAGDAGASTLGTGAAVASAPRAGASEAATATALGARIAAALADPDGAPLAPLLDDPDAAGLGTALRRAPGLVPQLLAGAGRPHPDLRLAADDPLHPPALVGRGRLPLERTLEQRLRAAVRRRRELGEPVDADELIDDEAERALHGYGLAEPEARALLTIGVVLAARLDPLDRTGARPPGFAGRLQARARKEAYVSHLRRELAAGAAIHPRQQGVVDDLAEFWRPWLTRLWVRLHGRDLTGEGLGDEPAELLAGILRSVLLDHRQRIRGALEREAA
ncbi:MAG: hypothetical protein GXX90_08105 [Microbacteriaceae bacterium]|nr:hypothetical protein [Microbacteriaceae bacterium]